MTAILFVPPSLSKTVKLDCSSGAIVSASQRLPAHLRTLFDEIDVAALKGSALDLKPTHADLLKRKLQQGQMR